MALILKTFAFVAFGLLVGCQAPGIPVADEHRALFPGEYSASLDDLNATLSITPALTYVYEQNPSAASRLDRIRLSGRLRITGPDSATAGQVGLRRKTKRTVVVHLPQDAPDPASGYVDTLDHEFTVRCATMRSQPHAASNVTLTRQVP